MKSNLKSNIIFYLIISIGLILSYLSFLVIYNIENKAIYVEFQKDVDERADSIYRETVINFEALRSLAILFNSNNNIPLYSKFSYEAQKIISRHKDIQALEWIPRIPHEKRNQYVKNIQDVFPDYIITERKKQKIMIKAKQRKEYFPVYYIEPFVGNELALGFDLASNKKRLLSLHESRDSAMPKASASITLVQGKAKRKAFLAFLPIYKGKPISQKKRQENLLGFILGVYVIEDIFISSSLNKIVEGIEMKLFDITIASKVDLLYAYNQNTISDVNKQIIYKKDLPDIWGKKWSLHASPTQSYISQRRSYLPILLVSFGLISTAFFAFYFRNIVKRTEIIQTMVIEKTNDLIEANKKLQLISRTDGLTQLYNRAYMDEVLKNEYLRSIRNKSSLSFIIIDIDYFKLYNDTYGHLQGDECLRQVSLCLQNIIKRPSDFLARYGGEEFVLILPETKDALIIANKCKEEIENLQIKHESSKILNVVSISVGLYTCFPTNINEITSIISRADEALYKAKECGRNRVEVFSF